MTRYYYRGWVGCSNIPVRGRIDLPDDVEWAQEAAMEWIVENLRRTTPYPLETIGNAHIAFFEKEPDRNPAEPQSQEEVHDL